MNILETSILDALFDGDLATVQRAQSNYHETGRDFLSIELALYYVGVTEK